MSDTGRDELGEIAAKKAMVALSESNIFLLAFLEYRRYALKQTTSYCLGQDGSTAEDREIRCATVAKVSLAGTFGACPACPAHLHSEQAVPAQV